MLERMLREGFAWIYQSDEPNSQVGGLAKLIGALPGGDRMMAGPAGVVWTIVQWEELKLSFIP